MATPISRRTLIYRAVRTCAALATGLAADAIATGTCHTSPEKLRVAAIGVGNRGRDNLIELEAEQVVALCDVDDEYLQVAAKKFPNATLYHDYRELLDTEAIDALLISTPDHSHAGPAVMAMRRGRHVYCEKPLAHNLQETRLLCEVAERHGVITQMGNQHRASAGYRRARQLLEARILGKVQAIHAWTLRPYWPQGVGRPNDEPPIPRTLNWDLWLGPAAERPYHSAYHPLRWRGWWDFGAGALGDMGTHLLDPVLSALRLGVPELIEAQSSEINEETLPSRSVIRFQFAATTNRQAIDVIWYDGGKQPPHELTGAARLPDEGVLVLGERGKMFIPPLGKEPRLVPAALAEDAPPPDEFTPSPGHIREWLEACKANAPDRCDTPFADGARLTNLCLLGKLALRVGTPIRWNAERQAPIDCPECLPWLGREYRSGWQLQ